MKKSPPKKATKRIALPAVKVAGADIAKAAREWLSIFKPRPKPKLSEFMTVHGRTDDGRRIRPFPFQADMADAFPDPETEQVTVRKSSRIGYSTILQCFVAWRIRYDPARSLIYQPTIDDAEKFSRDDLDPVLQWPIVREVATFKPRHADNQIRAKRYKGGWIQIKGANSPKEFRRVTADDVFLEECDGYPWAAREEGDPARLAFKRNLTSPRRFRAAGSTPKVKGFSRIDALFEQGSQEYRYVPCPQCGHMQVMVFGDGTGPGIRWTPKENPTTAWYRCENGCDIAEADKAWMDEQGEWRAHNPIAFPRHRSFHIWAAYSQHPGAAWIEIAREFMEVRHDPNLLRTFVNQVLGEAWQERGEAPEWERLYDRREMAMPIGKPPAWAGFLVGAADVQRAAGGRIELDIWAFGSGRRRALIDHIVVEGSIADKATWSKLDTEIARTWTSADGRSLKLARVGIDSGDGENTQFVYAWARRNPGKVMALKGRDKLAVSQPVAGPTWVDVTIGGRKIQKGVKLWTVGTSLLKLELYGQLQLEPPRNAEEEYPEGYIYLPDGVSDEWVKQLVAEQLVTVKLRNGRVRREWKQTRDRNEALDNAVYARAVAITLGVDRLTDEEWKKLTEPPPPPDPPAAKKKPKPPKPPVAVSSRAARAVAPVGRPSGNWLNRRGR